MITCVGVIGRLELWAFVASSWKHPIDPTRIHVRWQKGLPMVALPFPQ
jgi:hypothetical protein